MKQGDTRKSLREVEDQKKRAEGPRTVNGCTLPPGTSTTTIVPKDGSPSFELVLYDFDFMSNKIRRSGAWELSSVAQLADLAPSGILPPKTMGAVYDIGATVGYFGFLFAAAGYDVVAVEPELENIELLKASKCLNPKLANQITIVPVALSDAPKEGCQLKARVRKRAKKYLHSVPKLFCPAEEPCDPDLDLVCQENVVTTTLDGIIAQHNLPRPAIVKLDVEGQERQVMHGMAKTLRKSPPAFVQYENRDYRVEQEIADYLTSHGYVVGTARGHDQNTVAEYVGKFSS